MTKKVAQRKPRVANNELTPNQEIAVRQAFAVAVKSAEDPVSAGVYYRAIEIKLGLATDPNQEQPEQDV